MKTILFVTILVMAGCDSGGTTAAKCGNDPGWPPCTSTTTVAPTSTTSTSTSTSTTLAGHTEPWPPGPPQTVVLPTTTSTTLTEPDCPHPHHGGDQCHPHE